MATNFNQIVKAEIKRFLSSKKARTYTDNSNTWEPVNYTLDFEQNEEGEIVCTTWGYDYQTLEVPTTYGELVNIKTRVQLGISGMGFPQEITLPLYMEMMKKYQDANI